jgi:LacI family transcriptional regulator
MVLYIRVMSPSSRKASPPSVKDVASLAGVSVGTVSNVLNYPDRVSPILVERVNRSIDQLGYVRNEAARQLRVGQSKTIGLIIPNIRDPFHEELARGVDDAAAARDLSVLVGSSGGDTDRESHLLSLFETYRLAGIIIAPADTTPLPLRSLPTSSIPVVALNMEGQERGISSVSVDNVLAGELAAEHVIARGATRVVLLSWDQPTTAIVKEREQGAMSVFATHRNVSLDIVRLADHSVEAGRAIAHDLLSRAPDERPDAIMATHDLWAFGVLNYINARTDLDAPDDLLVVGCDDIDIHHIAPIPLTSIRLPAYEMGVAAVESVCAASESESSSTEHVKLAPVLVPRSSTSKPLSSGIGR